MSIQNACPSWPVLAEFVEGAVSESSFLELDEHLDRCAECRLVVGLIATGAVGEGSVGVPELPVGSVVGRFVIQAELGRGAMGIVYRALDQQLHRDVALKVPLWRKSGASVSDQLREARALACVRHPNVVDIYDVIGDRFIVMELIDGETLRGWQHKSRTVGVVLEAYLHAAAGLDAAHAAGIVHHDFKPDNVLVHSGGRVVVTDFGLAEVGRTEGSSGPLGGTPAYMAPEQLEGTPGTSLSDQYSFCVALLEALSQIHPRASASPARAIPHRLRRVIARGMSPLPSARYPSMAALARALSRTARPRRALRFVGLAAGVAFISLGLQSDRRCERPDSRWTAGTRAQVQAGLVQGGLPAEHAMKWDDAAGLSLERYGTLWGEAVVEACMLRALEARVCLAEQAGFVDGLVEALKSSDRAVALDVAGLLSTLSDPRDCLRDDGQTRPEMPPELLEAVEQLSHARVALRTGRLDEAEAIVDEQDRHRDVASAPDYRIRGDRIRASIHMQRGETQEAQGRLRSAHALAMDTGAHSQAAAVASRLVELVGVEQRRIGDAAVWVRASERAALASGSEDTMARHLLAVGRLRRSDGDFSGANAALHEALERAQRSSIPQPRLLGTILLEQAAVAFLLHEDDTAHDLYARSLRAVVASFGPADSLVAEAVEGMATVAARRGDAGKALEITQWLYERSLELLGPDNLRTAEAQARLATMTGLRGDSAEAERLLGLAIGVMEDSRQADPLELGAAYVNLGQEQAARGRLEPSLRSHRRGVDVLRAVGDEGSWLLSEAMTNLGRIEWLLGRAADAEATTRQVIAMLERGEGDGSARLVVPLLSLGEILSSTRPRQALAAFERAREIAVQGGVQPRHHAIAMVSVAEMLEGLGEGDRDRGRSLSLAREAEAIFEGMGAQGRVHLDTLRPWMEQLEAPSRGD